MEVLTGHNTDELVKSTQNHENVVYKNRSISTWMIQCRVRRADIDLFRRGIVVEYRAAGQLPTRRVQLYQLQQCTTDGWRRGCVQEGVADRTEESLEVAG